MHLRARATRLSWPAAAGAALIALAPVTEAPAAGRPAHVLRMRRAARRRDHA